MEWIELPGLVVREGIWLFLSQNFNLDISELSSWWYLETWQHLKEVTRDGSCKPPDLNGKYRRDTLPGFARWHHRLRKCVATDSTLRSIQVVERSDNESNHDSREQIPWLYSFSLCLFCKGAESTFWHMSRSLEEIVSLTLSSESDRSIGSPRKENSLSPINGIIHTYIHTYTHTHFDSALCSSVKDSCCLHNHVCLNAILPNRLEHGYWHYLTLHSALPCPPPESLLWNYVFGWEFLFSSLSSTALHMWSHLG